KFDNISPLVEGLGIPIPAAFLARGACLLIGVTRQGAFLVVFGAAPLPLGLPSEGVGGGLLVGQKPPLVLSVPREFFVGSIPPVAGCDLPSGRRLFIIRKQVLVIVIG